MTRQSFSTMSLLIGAGLAVTAATAAPAGSSKFTIAIMPDTQQEVLGTSTRFRQRSEWLVANREALNLRFVTHSGDVVNWGAQDPPQFVVASDAMRPLETAAIPYSLAIGNHDTAAVCEGGSACPGVSIPVAVRDTTAFNATFPPSRYAALTGEFEAGKVDNSWSTFEASGLHWMVMTLELWPRQVAIAWANRVVAAHPGHNVIVVTHSYLTATADISASNGGYGATSPQFLFDNFIKLHANIRFVFSGHVGTAASRVDTGVNGNAIHSFLQAFHATTNPVRLFEIDPLAGSVATRIYAPFTNTQYPQFDVSLSNLSFVPGDVIFRDGSDSL